jgi:hypothetical protein
MLQKTAIKKTPIQAATSDKKYFYAFKPSEFAREFYGKLSFIDDF